MFAPSHQNRLSIALLLLWTLVASALFAIHTQDIAIQSKLIRSFPDTSPEIVRRQELVVRASGGIQLACLPVLATAILGAFLWVVRWNRASYPTAPGHWLLVSMGWFVLTLEANVLIVYALSQRDPQAVHEVFWQVYLLWKSLELIGTSLAALSLGLAFCRTRENWPWTLVILLIAISMAALSLHHLARLIGSFSALALNPVAATALGLAHFGYLLGVAAMLLGCFLDWRQGIRRDLFHFAGITVVIVVIVARFSGEISRLIV